MFFQRRESRLHCKVFELTVEDEKKKRFSEKSGERKNLVWQVKKSVMVACKKSSNIKSWAGCIAKTGSHMKVKLAHFGLNTDLVSSIWNEQGSF